MTELQQTPIDPLEERMLARANELIPGISESDADLLVRLGKISQRTGSSALLLSALDAVRRGNGYMTQVKANLPARFPIMNTVYTLADEVFHGGLAYRLTRNPKLDGSGVHLLSGEAMAFVEHDPELRRRSEARNTAPHESYLFFAEQSVVIAGLSSLVRTPLTQPVESVKI